jgi:phosphoribosylamine-glycine ligase
VAIKDTEVEKLVEFAKANNVELTVVGPEASLAAGVVDRFRAVEVPYDGAAAANLGATAYWNASGKKVSATANGNTEIGHFGASVKSGAATCVVLLK